MPGVLLQVDGGWLLLDTGFNTALIRDPDGSWRTSGDGHVAVWKDGTEVGLAGLFGEHDTLVTYFWMYGPERERPCPMCTSLLGSLDIPAVDLEQRVALAVIGRSPPSCSRTSSSTRCTR